MRTFVGWCFFFSCLPVMAQPLTAEQWREDVEFLAATIVERHANPYARVSREDFESRVAELVVQAERPDRRRITIGMMRLVASLRDGHSELHPVGERGFADWYPLRFHVFADGVYLTALPPDWDAVRGLPVVGVNGRPAGDVLDEVTALFGADNRFNQRSAAFLASSADILRGLGIVGDDGVLRLEFRRSDGQRIERTLSPEAGEPSMDWLFWGEYFGPPGLETVGAFEMRDPMPYLDTPDDERPLHMRHRAAYQYVHQPENSLLYFQMNAVYGNSSRSEQTLFEMWREALEITRARPSEARRLVIDLRYNFGGDGSLVPRFVNQLIRLYPHIEDPGHIFIVTGPFSFSAAVMLADEILTHVPGLLVGEPMGAPFNAYGDAEAFTLPNSGYTLWLSRRWWQLRESDDERRFIPVQVPAAMTGAAYFARQDPVLDAILSQPVPYPILGRIAGEQGGAAALRAFESQQAQWGGLDYWQPVGRFDLERAAEALRSAGRLADAIAAYRINTRVFPDDWDTWSDLGRTCYEAGDDSCTVQAYRRALELNPTNWSAQEQRDVLDSLGQ